MTQATLAQPGTVRLLFAAEAVSSFAGWWWSGAYPGGADRSS
jgi:hypothetical protein